MNVQSTPLPDHVENSIRSISQLHADHVKAATSFQRTVNLTVAWVGRPACIGVLTLFVICWTGANLLAMRFGHHPLDPPPFQWAELGCSFFALYVTILILITQRHDDEIGRYREQLTLQLALLSDQKAAKIIQLLEEIRRDSPHLVNRLDGHADAMAMPLDPESILEAIKRSTAEHLDQGQERDAAP